MEISAQAVRELREMTGAGMMDCKKALNKADGDIQKAVAILREQGLSKAAQKATRTASEGLIYSYIHPGDKLGVLLEINCETDFVARTDDFRGLAKDIAMQIAAANPLVVQREQIDPGIIEKETDIYKTQALNEGKPEKFLEKIIQGRLEKFYQETVLLEQLFIKDQDISIKDLLTNAIGKLGENIVVKRFARYRLGE
ncbi:MAG TPA: translation elongation factor Ts [candidate division Zixibacteria bacterium]|jgi:elongation factor Ts|nr:translation elongation factor Ts [candidate division Zixibacteria bacterium]HBY99971.1 translation elongation factor Ts [candidate division Zixibacteria bacterium]